MKVILCDMNILWRVAKVVYNREHAASPVRGALRDICPVYGMARIQGVCLLYTRLFHLFLSSWSMIAS